MDNLSTKELKEKRQQLMDKIDALEGKVLRGSVIESYKKCGKPDASANMARVMDLSIP